MDNLQRVSGTQVAFSGYDPAQASAPHGYLAVLDAQFPSVLRAMPGGGLYEDEDAPAARMKLRDEGTHYGYVLSGKVILDWGKGNIFLISEGFYFSIPGASTLHAFDRQTQVFVVTRLDYRGFFHIGQIEQEGRLRYIDGCTDSLLIPPVRFGDPCLNLLYFPANVIQTMHTHPSVRAGVILSGNGICDYEDEAGRHSLPLVPGMYFAIHTDGRHRFRTGDSPMRVLAYHPDSDFGPTDEQHPMINRTMVEGVSARELVEIHTA